MLRPRMYLELSRDHWRFDIPVLAVELFGKPQPDPWTDPLRPVGKPQPVPWFEGRGIDAALAHDLQVAATFRAAAGARISAELRQVVEPALKAMEQALAARLPEGIALGMRG